MRIAGIDPDTKNITIVLLSSRERPEIIRLEAKGRRAEDRVAQLYHQLADTILGVDWVYVEVPMFARNAGALKNQCIVLGMIRYWLWDANIPHSLVDPGVWKKSAMGNGHASKEEIAVFAQDLLNMPEGQPQDVYDAAVIAHYGISQHDPS